MAVCAYFAVVCWPDDDLLGQYGHRDDYWRAAYIHLVTPKLLGFGALALLVGGVFLYVSGKHAGVQQEQALTAQKIAATANHVADSVATVYAQRFDSAKKSTAQRIAEADAKTNAAARQTNQAVAGANDAVQRAEALLSDSSATITALRGALQTDNHAIDSLTATMERERQANVEARQVRDSNHVREVTLLHTGFAQTLAARDTADAKRGLAFAADLRQASGASLRKGRIEGAVGTALLIALVKNLVK